MRFMLCSTTLIVITLLNGCKNSPTESVVNNYYYTSDSLTNSNVKPKVTFTVPSDKAIGPFNNTMGGDPTSPLITIQLNKLINVADLDPRSVRLTTDNVDYNLYLSDYVYENTYSNPFMRNILIFAVPFKYLANKTYTVTVDSTLIDIDGYKLSTPYIFSFVPEPRFRVYSESPGYDNLSTISSSPLSLNLNSDVDSSFFGKIQIVPPIRGKWQYNPTSYFLPTVDSSVVYFVYQDTLLYDTKYTISVAADAKDANGLVIGSTFQSSFTTEPFEIASWTSSSETGVSGFSYPNYFSFYFDGALDTSTVRSSVVITPTVSFSISFSNYQYNIGSFSLELQNSQILPNTTYTITLKTTLTSKNGTHMKVPFSYPFTTGS